MREGYAARLLRFAGRQRDWRERMHPGPDKKSQQDLPVVPRTTPADPPIYLGDRRLLVRTRWGGRLVVPTYNIDVAIGAARDGLIEPWTTRLVQELVREGDVVINAGANFGYYSVLSAQIVGAGGRVIAIEANPHIVPYLIASCFWSGVSNRVAIYSCAAWHKSGETLTFFFSPAFLGAGSATELWSSESPQGPARETIDEAMWDETFVRANTDELGRVQLDAPVRFQATTRTIDDICADVPRAHLIHMDIEGAEALALQGAKGLVQRSADIRIVFEWSSHRYKHGSPEARKGFEETWKWLVGQGFRVRELFPRIADNGGIYVSEPVEFDYLAHQAASGDFVAIRSHNDPWGSGDSVSHGLITVLKDSPLPLELATQIADSQKRLEGWCRDEKAIWLASLVLDRGIRIALEIGIFGGRSLLPVAFAMKHVGAGVVYGVEPWSQEVASEVDSPDRTPADREWWSKVNFGHMKRSFLEYICRNDLAEFVRIIEVPSDIARLMFSAPPYRRSIDLMHIDGAHDEQQALRDVTFWTDVVADNGYVVLDDTTWPSVQKAKRWMDERFKIVDEKVFS